MISKSTVLFFFNRTVEKYKLYVMVMNENEKKLIEENKKLKRSRLTLLIFIIVFSLIYLYNTFA